MRVIILGGGGMLGHQLCRVMSPSLEVHATFRSFDERLRELGGFQKTKAHEGVDARDFVRLETVLLGVRPDWVVNCIGIIKQAGASRNPEACLAINALLPHRLARACANVGARLIHISTDCVFSGNRGDYTEEDVSDAQDLYGRTKFLGEVAEENALTIRTSIVGSALADDLSLFDWFLGRGSRPTKGFTQSIYTGLTTRRLGRELLKIMGLQPALSGLWQVSSEKISKYELLLMLKRALSLTTAVIPDYDFKCDRSLDSSRYQKETGYVPPVWEEMIDDYARDLRQSYPWKLACPGG